MEGIIGPNFCARSQSHLRAHPVGLQTVAGICGSRAHDRLPTTMVTDYWGGGGARSTGGRDRCTPYYITTT